jgi:hypothetical protein
MLFISKPLLILAMHRYQILRQHYQFTVFQAVRGALWLTR